MTTITSSAHSRGKLTLKVFRKLATESYISKLVLQFPLSSQAATAMACLGYLLVPTPPAGPANDLRWRVSRDPQEADQESTDLRVSEIWRYQPCQPRTS